MRYHAKNFTEPILATPAPALERVCSDVFARLDRYCTELARHPLLVAAQHDQLSPEILLELAFHQYADSILWIPMLAQMKAKAVRSPRLARAIRDNIGHEAGLDGVSHVTLAASFMRSLGVKDGAGFPAATLGHTVGEWLTDEFAEVTEAGIAGWLLTSETLVPRLFAAIAPSFAQRAGCDTRYFTEHIAVDGDEHSTWMAEAVVEVIAIYGPDAAADVAGGMEAAWDEAIEVPDTLWRRQCASR